ncbi:MAG: hypothetical protein INR63_08605 [Actinomycetospora chiangmaiensis]|nr:hypothetical protein [Actinomycetospora chiangmaiensis]
MSESDSRPALDVLAEDPAGARAYPPKPMAKRPQGPRSPGQSEPGDMGAFDNKAYAEPQHESPAGNGGTGYRGA